MTVAMLMDNLVTLKCREMNVKFVDENTVPLYDLDKAVLKANELFSSTSNKFYTNEELERRTLVMKKRGRICKGN